MRNRLVREELSGRRKIFDFVGVPDGARTRVTARDCLTTPRILGDNAGSIQWTCG
jgi:hypothetical protein